MSKLLESQLDLHLKELGKNIDNLTPAQVKKTRKLCNKLGVGESKNRRKEKDTKGGWLSSRQAKTLEGAFPKNKKVATAAWNMASGTRKRTPLYILSATDEKREIFKDSLKYIIDNYTVSV